MKAFETADWREDGKPGVEIHTKTERLIFDTVVEAAEWAEMESEALIELIEAKKQ